MAALGEWLRVGAWELGEPFMYEGKECYKIDNPEPQLMVVEVREGRSRERHVVKIYAYLYECEADGCRMYVFSPANMEEATQ